MILNKGSMYSCNVLLADKLYNFIVMHYNTIILVFIMRLSQCRVLLYCVLLFIGVTDKIGLLRKTNSTQGSVFLSI